MKHLIWVVLPLVALGCLKPIPKSEPAAPTTTSTTPATPAATGGGGVTMSGGPGGGIVTGDLSQPAAQSTQPAATQPTNTEPAKAATPKAPARLVDATEALKNPKVIVASTKITGEDPLTAAFQAYFSVRAKAQILNFQNQVKISRELNDGKPLKFEQFMELVQQLKIEFIDLPPWQMLGYDSKTSDLVLLEDKAVKIAHYKSANIPLDAGDEKYDTP